MGKIDIFCVEKGEKSEDKNKYVVNLYGQNRPGKPVQDIETEEMRLSWFEMGLNQLADIVAHNTVVAFPFMIGCGLAGGNWPRYQMKISEFNEKVKGKGVEVVIVCLE